MKVPAEQVEVIYSILETIPSARYLKNYYPECEEYFREGLNALLFSPIGEEWKILSKVDFFMLRTIQKILDGEISYEEVTI